MQTTTRSIRTLALIVELVLHSARQELFLKANQYADILRKGIADYAMSFSFALDGFPLFSRETYGMITVP